MDVLRGGRHGLLVMTSSIRTPLLLMCIALVFVGAAITLSFPSGSGERIFGSVLSFTFLMIGQVLAWTLKE